MHRLVTFWLSALVVLIFSGCSKESGTGPMTPTGVAAPRLGVEVKVMGVVGTRQPAVILSDQQEEVLFPILIGSCEAWAILTELEGIEPPRPLTHDLLRSVIDTLNMKVTDVFINRIEEEIIFAEIGLQSNGSAYSVDSRPSDAIALALRAPAPIFISEALLDSLGMSAADNPELVEALKGEEGGKPVLDLPSPQ